MPSAPAPVEIVNTPLLQPTLGKDSVTKPVPSSTTSTDALSLPSSSRTERADLQASQKPNAEFPAFGVGTAAELPPKVKEYVSSIRNYSYDITSNSQLLDSSDTIPPEVTKFNQNLVNNSLKNLPDIAKSALANKEIDQKTYDAIIIGLTEFQGKEVTSSNINKYSDFVRSCFSYDNNSDKFVLKNPGDKEHGLYNSSIPGGVDSVWGPRTFELMNCLASGNLKLDKNVAEKFEEVTQGIINIEQGFKITGETASASDQTGVGSSSSTQNLNIEQYTNSGEFKGPGNEVLILRQTDPRWADRSYGSSTIYNGACGPTSMAMILNFYHKKNQEGQDFTPVDTVDYAVKNGFRIDGQGTAWEFFGSIGEKYGLKTTQIESSKSDKDIEAIKNELAKGNPVIVSTEGLPFTSSGHFLVVTGFDAKSGQFTYADPGPRNVTHTDSETLRNALAGYWTFSPKS